MANELNQAPSFMAIQGIENLNDRMCQLRINAIMTVLRHTGHPVSDLIALQVTPSRVFQEEERIIASSNSDLAVASRALMAAARGMSSVPPTSTSVPRTTTNYSAGSPPGLGTERAPHLEPMARYSEDEGMDQG